MVDGRRPLQLLVAKAADYLEAGLTDAALMLLEGHVADDPQDAAAVHLLGLARRASGDLDGAIECLRRATAIAGGTDAAFDLGQTLIAAGRHREAAAVFRDALDGAHTGSPRLWLGLANALSAQGDHAGAAAAAGRAVEEDRSPQSLGHLGVVLLRAKRYEDALGPLREAVERDGRSRSIRHNLAIALRESGRVEEAVAECRSLVAAEPSSPAALDLFGACLRRAGRLEEAWEAHRQAVALAPDDPVILHNAAIVAGEIDRPEVALDLLSRAVDRAPDNPEILTTFGNALKTLNRLEEAKAVLEKAIALAPESAIAHHNLASVCERMGRRQEARALYRRAVELAPDNPDIHSNFGVLLAAMKLTAEAEQVLRRAIDLDGNHKAAWTNLGSLYLRENRLAEAAFALERALAIDPSFVSALQNMAGVCAQQRDYDRAVEVLQRARKVQPDYPPVNHNLGLYLTDLGSIAEALDSHRRALACARPEEAAFFRSNYLFCMDYDERQDARSLAEAHREWDRHHGRRNPDPRRPHRHSRDPARRLRIGFVSPDFRRHSVANFLLPVMEALDRRAFHVSCYSVADVPDEITPRFIGLADEWIEAGGFSDGEFVDRLRGDAIDVLIDLAGHTGNNRLPVFARRPAPVQVTWLGYPGSTGLSAIDWRISDSAADPEGLADALSAERIKRLDPCFLCFRPIDPAPPVSDPPFLRNGFVTFGSFNTVSKLSDGVLRRWAEILAAVPDSRLLLKAKQLGSARSRERVLGMLAGGGIDAGRIVINPYRREVVDHLAQYAEVDIALDTFPYNGTTTSCEAMWMGVPVVTLAGDRHVARVGASLARVLGLGGLVAEDAAGYVDIAVRLAADRDSLAALRAGLRARMQQSALGDAAGFARRFETALREMWGEWCAGPPTFEMADD